MRVLVWVSVLLVCLFLVQAEPMNVSLPYKAQEYNLTWAQFDNISSYSIILQNETTNISGTYFLINVSKLSPGVVNNVYLGYLNDSLYLLYQSGWIERMVNHNPTAPGISMPGNVDLSNGSLNISIGQSSDIDNDSIIYILKENNITIYNGTYISQYIITNRSDGSWIYEICVVDQFGASNCSQSSTTILSIVAPRIISSTHGIGFPFYWDKAEVYVSVVVQIYDKRDLTVNATYKASEDDYYEDDYDVIRNMTCSQASNDNGTRSFNCSGKISYLMQPGFYDLTVNANNGFKVSSSSFAERINIGTVLSFYASMPGDNYDDVYNGMADLSPPMYLRSTGNLPFTWTSIDTEDIRCSDTIFKKEDIYVSDRDNRGSSVSSSLQFIFDERISRGEQQEVYFYVNNTDMHSGNSCKTRWYISADYMQ